MATPEHLLPDPARGDLAPGRVHGRPRGRLWHAAAVAFALAVAWLVMRAYRQPGFIVDFANVLLC